MAILCFDELPDYNAVEDFVVSSSDDLDCLLIEYNDNDNVSVGSKLS